VHIDGEDITRRPPHKRDLGMVFQSYALFPHMTVAENLAFPLEVRKLPKSEIEAKVNRALGMVRLDEFGGRRPAQLSGGQQQRVAVARAIVSRPALVLADEPTANLDSHSADSLMELFVELNQHHNTTFVIATHDQRVMAYAKRVIRMLDGRIVDDIDQQAA
jgi:putative spermidine/putrescine transport system ATP-binding protein